jgi:hypothetical protein
MLHLILAAGALAVLGCIVHRLIADDCPYALFCTLVWLWLLFWSPDVLLFLSAPTCFYGVLREFRRGRTSARRVTA